MRQHAAVIGLAFGLMVALLSGQSTVEVASIKRNTSADSAQGSRILPGGRIEITNMPLRALIRIAFGTTGSQVVGGPDWIAADGYNIAATVTGDPAAALRPLLEERFHLQVHTEKREVQTYALVLANKDGKPGLNSNPRREIAHLGRRNAAGSAAATAT
jgi:uncharacterized protein (TIGR03435 family)